MKNISLRYSLSVTLNHAVKLKGTVSRPSSLHKLLVKLA